MTAVGHDTLATRSTLQAGGQTVSYYSLDKAAAKLGDVSRLPFSMKVLLENLLRFEDGGFTVSTADIQALIDWQKSPTSDAEIQLVRMYAPAMSAPMRIISQLRCLAGMVSASRA